MPDDISLAVDAYLAQKPKEDLASKMGSGVGSVLGVNPDYEAELMRVSQKIGVPLETARNLPEDTKRAVRLSDFDYPAIADQFPRTAELYSDPNHARVAIDDLNTYTGLEKAFNGYRDTNNPGYSFFPGGVTLRHRDQAVYLPSNGGWLNKTADGEFLPAGHTAFDRTTPWQTFKDWMPGGGWTATPEERKMLYRLKGAPSNMMSALKGSVGTGFFGILAGVPRLIQTGLEAVDQGQEAIDRAGLAKDKAEGIDTTNSRGSVLTRDLGLPQFFKRLADRADEHTAAYQFDSSGGGFKGGVKSALALVGGLAPYAIGGAPAGAKMFIDAYGRRDTALQGLGVDPATRLWQAGGAAIPDAVIGSAVGENSAFPSVMRDLLGKSTSTGIGFLAKHFGDQVVNEALGIAPIANPNETFGEWMYRVAVNGGIESFVGGFAITTMFALKPVIGQQIENRQNMNLFKALGEAGQNSKTMKRLPQQYQDSVAKLTEGGPVKDVYVAKEALLTFFQDQKGMSLEEAQAEVTKLAGANASDIDATGKVQIPISSFAKDVAPNPDMMSAIQHDFAFKPGALTPREQVAWEAGGGWQRLKDLSATVSTEVAPEAQASEAWIKVKDDLAKRYSQDKTLAPEQVDALATKDANVFFNLATAEGLVPHELLQLVDPQLKLRPYTVEGVEDAQGNRGASDQTEPGGAGATGPGTAGADAGRGSVLRQDGTIDPGRLAQRIVDAISDREIKRDAELALTPLPTLEQQLFPEDTIPKDGETLFQVQNLPEWMGKMRDWMVKNGYSKLEIIKHLHAVEGQMKIFSALGPVQLEMLPRGAGEGSNTYMNKDAGPIRDNNDMIYKLSFDLTSMCVKRLEAGATATYVQQMLRTARPDNPTLSSSELVALVSLFKEAGKQAPCLYCYVEAPRTKVNDMVSKGLQIAFGKMEIPSTWNEGSRKMVPDVKAYIAKSGVSMDKIDINAVLDPEFAASEKGQALIAEHPEVYDFLSKTARFVTNANKQKRYEEYNGQILRIPNHILNELNGYAGFRFFSSSDFQPEHIVDLMSAMHDLALRKAKAHAYTKVTDFVDIFGNTGMKIQTSVFAKHDPVTGEIVMDDWQGMHWDDAKRLRETHPNVGTVLVGTTPEIIQWGKEQPWIDYIIPYHASGLELPYQEAMGWADFSKVQHEARIDGAKIEYDQKIRMHDLGIVDGISDQELTKRYLELCLDRKQVPVFPQFMFKDFVPGKEASDVSPSERNATNPKGEKAIRKAQADEAIARWKAMVENGKIDWTQIDMNFGKVKKDFARTDTPFEAIRPEFDMNKAAEVMNGYFKGETTTAKPDHEIAAKLLEQIQTAEPGVNIGADNLSRMRRGETLFQPDQEGKQPRGWFNLNSDGTWEIGKTPIGDFSTFVHEPAHGYLKLIQDLASREGASDVLKGDVTKILGFLGSESMDTLTTEQHEKWARANEQYLREGVAPSKSLTGVFQRFAVWLGSIYKKAEELKVELSPEIKEVFDRMYAAEEGVNKAHDELGPQLFKTAEEAGWTPEQFKKYAELKGLEIQDAKAEILARVNEDALREKSDAYREELRNVKVAVTAEVDASPEYHAIRSLRRGAMDDGTAVSLSRKGLVDLIGEDGVKSLQELHPNLYRKEGGLDPQTAAEMLGFRSAQEMVDAMKSSPKRADAVEAASKRYMVSKHGDIRYDGTLEDQARLAVINDQRAENLQNELVNLRNKLHDVWAKQDDQQNANRAALDLPPIDAYRTQAREMIVNKLIGDIQPNTYLNAMRRYSRESYEKMGKGNPEEAYQAKQKELLNHFLYTESVKGRKEMDKFDIYRKASGKNRFQEMLGKADRPEEEGMPPGEYRNQFNDLVSQFDDGNLPKQSSQALEVWAMARAAEGEPILIDPSVYRLTGKGWKDLSLSEMRSVKEALRNIETLARNKNKVMSGEAKIDKEAAVAEMTAAAYGNHEAKPRVLDKETRSMTEKAVSWAKWMNSGIKKMEHLVDELDGGDINGPWRRNVFEPLCLAQFKEYELTQRVTNKLSEAMEAMPKEQRQSLTNIYDIPGLGGPVTKKFILSMALNWGNEGNRTKMLKGMGWANNPDVVAEAFKKLNRADWEFVQKTWDALETLWPDISDLQVRGTGVAPPKVERTPTGIQLADGTTMHLQGGYYPLVYDRTRSTTGEKQADSDIMKQEGGYNGPVTFKGHTNARVDQFSAPLNMDFEYVLARHTIQVIKDLSHREAATSVAKLIKDQRVRDAVTDTFGQEYTDMLMPWLKGTVNDVGGQLGADLQGWKSMLMTTRSNMVIAGLAFRASSVLVQATDFMRSTTMVPMRHLGGALIDFMSHPIETPRLVRELSQEMMARSENLDRDVRDMIKRQTADPLHHHANKMQKFGMHMLAVADTVTSVTTWLGAYKNAQEKGSPQEQAVREADRAVRMTMMSSAPKDQVAIQRAGDVGLKFVTMFMGDATSAWGLMNKSFNKVAEGDQVAKNLWTMALVGMIAPIAGDLIKMRGPQDDEDKAWWAAKKALLSLPSSIPIARDIAQAMDSGMDYKFTPLSNVVNKGLIAYKSAGGAMDQSKPATWEDAFVHALDAAGTLAGVPGTSQVMTTVNYLRDIEKGKRPRPTSDLEFASNLVMGPPPKAKH